MLITDDLKYIAGHYLYNPGSHVDLRVRRSRSGSEKVLISLDIPIPSKSGPPRPEYYAFEIPARIPSPLFPPIHSAPLTVSLTTGKPSWRLGPSQSRTSCLQ